MTTLDQRLNNNEIVLLDGGVTTEIQRQGGAMNAEVWGGIAHRTDPEIVLKVHESYIKAGAQVITANTYSTARHILADIGLADQASAINREAIQLAQKARDNAAVDEVWIAASMSSTPGLNNDRYNSRNKEAADSYREMAEVFAETGADLIIAEMMLDFVNANMVIEAAVSTGLPVWVGYSAMTMADGTVTAWRKKHTEDNLPHDDFSELIQTVSKLGGQAAGIMHTDIEDIDPALRIFREHWTGPALAYAEAGFLNQGNWVFQENCTPEAYAETAVSWIEDHGIQIIGGCCGTGPEHIRVLKEILPKHLLGTG